MEKIPDKENLTIEFKSDRKGGYPDRDLVEAIVAMANTEGGNLYLGVEDNGEITGLTKKHEDEIGLTAMVMNNIVPSLYVRAEIISENKINIMNINIPKSKVVVATRQGKILRRTLKSHGEPENIPMYPFEITTRLSNMELLDFSAQTIEEASIDDFDSNEIIRLRKLIKISNGDELLLELNDEELEKALQLVKEIKGVLKPTITGILLIGKEQKIKEYVPTSQAIFQVLEGTEIRKNEEFSQSLLSMLEIFETYFDAWNSEKETEEGLLRVKVPEFSKRAFREALINAFAHRDYTMIGSVRVAIDDDGLTISNPGGFIEGVNIDNLLTVEPHGRNKALSDALKRIGLTEKTGRGIDRIYEGSIIYGKPWPDYSESNEVLVKLFIPRAKADFEFIKMINEEQDKMGKTFSFNSLLILSCIKSQKRINLKRLVELTHLSNYRVKSNIEELVEKGIVESLEKGSNKFYTLSTNAYKSNNNEPGYIKPTEIEEHRYDELVLNLAKIKNEGICRKDVCDLLNISKDQAYRLLKRLTNNGKLYVEGQGNKTKYKII